eukprot:TRINITY_DN9803_c0_g1_i1.p1 TRINITY_DN9803_c0_g1~~TRINITY_DN9803_c0_g1_i1.p1  ORF type:complete len:1625 (+),score=683.28 TRINITY_DN9803_c0_g1_i1:72-4877(+)
MAAAPTPTMESHRPLGATVGRQSNASTGSMRGGGGMARFRTGGGPVSNLDMGDPDQSYSSGLELTRELQQSIAMLPACWNPSPRSSPIAQGQAAQAGDEESPRNAKQRWQMVRGCLGAIARFGTVKTKDQLQRENTEAVHQRNLLKRVQDNVTHGWFTKKTDQSLSATYSGRCVSFAPSFCGPPPEREPSGPHSQGSDGAEGAEGDAATPPPKTLEEALELLSQKNAELLESKDLCFGAAEMGMRLTMQLEERGYLISDLKDQVDQLTAQVEKMGEENEQLMGKVQQARLAERRLQATFHEAEDKHAQVGELEQKITELEEQIVAERKEREEEKNKDWLRSKVVSGLKAFVRDDKVAKAQTQILKLEKQIAENEELIEALQQTEFELRDTVAQRESTITARDLQVADVVRERDQAISLLEDARKTAEQQVRSAGASAEAEVKARDLRLSALEEALQAQRVQCDELQQQLVQSDAALRDSRSQLAAAEEHAAGLQKALDDLTAESAAREEGLERKLAALRESSHAAEDAAAARLAELREELATQTAQAREALAAAEAKAAELWSQLEAKGREQERTALRLEEEGGLKWKAQVQEAGQRCEELERQLQRATLGREGAEGRERECRAKLEEAARASAALEAQLGEWKVEVASLQCELAQAQRDKDRAVSAAAAEREELGARLSAAEQASERAAAQLRAAQGEAAQLQQQLQSAKQQHAAAEAQWRDERERAARERASEQAAAAERAELQAARLRQLQQAADAAKSRIASLESEVSALQCAAIAAPQHSGDGDAAREAKLEHELKGAQEKIRRLEEDLAHRERLHSDQMRALDTERAELRASLDRALAGAAEADERFAQEARKWQQALAAAREAADERLKRSQAEGEQLSGQLQRAALEVRRRLAEEQATTANLRAARSELERRCAALEDRLRDAEAGAASVRRMQDRVAGSDQQVRRAADLDREVRQLRQELAREEQRAEMAERAAADLRRSHAAQLEQLQQAAMDREEVLRGEARAEEAAAATRLRAAQDAADAARARAERAEGEAGGLREELQRGAADCQDRVAQAERRGAEQLRWQAQQAEQEAALRGRAEEEAARLRARLREADERERGAAQGGAAGMRAAERDIAVLRDELAAEIAEATRLRAAAENNTAAGDAQAAREQLRHSEQACEQYAAAATRHAEEAARLQHRAEAAQAAAGRLSADCAAAVERADRAEAALRTAAAEARDAEAAAAAAEQRCALTQADTRRLEGELTEARNALAAARHAAAARSPTRSPPRRSRSPQRPPQPAPDTSSIADRLERQYRLELEEMTEREREGHKRRLREVESDYAAQLRAARAAARDAEDALRRTQVELADLRRQHTDAEIRCGDLTARAGVLQTERAAADAELLRARSEAAAAREEAERLSAACSRRRALGSEEPASPPSPPEAHSPPPPQQSPVSPPSPTALLPRAPPAHAPAARPDEAERLRRRLAESEADWQKERSALFRRAAAAEAAFTEMRAIWTVAERDKRFLLGGDSPSPAPRPGAARPEADADAEGSEARCRAAPASPTPLAPSPDASAWRATYASRRAALTARRQQSEEAVVRSTSPRRARLSR